MRIVRKEEAAAAAGDQPESGLQVQWWEDPPTEAALQVGMVTLAPGGATPPHVHVGGQVMVVVSGRGFVEADGHREELAPGDVVIAPPGELHTHGAADDSAMAHLTVTTGGYTFPAVEDG